MNEYSVQNVRDQNKGEYNVDRAIYFTIRKSSISDPSIYIKADKTYNFAQKKPLIFFQLIQINY